MKIIIKTTGQEEIRNQDVGDWYEHEGVKYIKVLEMGNENYSFLIALHELLEQKFCEKDRVPEWKVTNFDANFRGEGEPGMNLKAPYRKQHIKATQIEALVCGYLGLSWKKYDDFITKGLYKVNKNKMPAKKMRSVAPKGLKGKKVVKGIKKVAKTIKGKKVTKK